MGQAGGEKRLIVEKGEKRTHAGRMISRPPPEKLAAGVYRAAAV